jgi:hypothetical protein
MNKLHTSFSLGLLISIITTLIGADSTKEDLLCIYGYTPLISKKYVEQADPKLQYHIDNDLFTSLQSNAYASACSYLRGLFRYDDRICFQCTHRLLTQSVNNIKLLQPDYTKNFIMVSEQQILQCVQWTTKIEFLAPDTVLLTYPNNIVLRTKNMRILNILLKLIPR